MLIISDLIYDAIQRYTSTEWSKMTDVRLNYDLVFSVLVLFLVACVYGLFTKQKWGYSFAMSANGILVAISLASFLISLHLFLTDISLLEIFDMNLVNLSVSVISFCFCILLYRSKDKLT